MVAGETQVAQRPNRETPTRQWYDGVSLEVRGGAALLEDAELEGQALATKAVKELRNSAIAVRGGSDRCLPASPKD